MWLINKWYSETIDIETEFFYALIEEEIHLKIPLGMAEVLEEDYTYKELLRLIKCINIILQAVRFWFRDYIRTMTLKLGVKQYKTDFCLS